MSDVSVVGLGQMGSVLAKLLLVVGQSVTVWNRTSDKAKALGAQGAKVVNTPAEAFAASPLTLIILYDDAAVKAVLSTPGVDTAVNDRLIVNLGTSGPEAARDLAAVVAALGGRYVDGAIQAAPSQMGQVDTPILVSGSPKDVASAEAVLRILGGNLVTVGQSIDATAFMDLATLSYVYGGFAGFLHGARIAESVGIDVGVYGKLVQDISPSFGAFFAYEGGVIQSGDFTVSESPLRISVSAVARIVESSRTLGLDTALPALVAKWLTQADRDGMAGEELAALIKVLRSGGNS
jgi:3-hydroxyisobutyrate dehydrogenase-like beta-hydroxyacid dehydrogenase